MRAEPPVRKTKVELNFFKGKFTYESIRPINKAEPEAEKKDPVAIYNFNYVPDENKLFGGLN